MENFCFMQYGKNELLLRQCTRRGTSFFEYVKAGARVLKVSDHLLHVQLPPRVTCSFPAEPPLQTSGRQFCCVIYYYVIECERHRAMV